tara:strand:- start:941 stop:1165 length:225 start_codon:yes stop_codon:yes gene_type:complete
MKTKTQDLKWVAFINDNYKNEKNQLIIFDFEDYPTIEDVILELEYEDYNTTGELTDREVLNLNSIVLTDEIIIN